MERTTNGARPIKLVTFDLYDTLIELRPPRWERMTAACARHGIQADAAALKAADRIAEDYFTEENTTQPIRDRSPEDREAFRLEYTRRWLRAAGSPHDAATLRLVRRSYLAEFDQAALDYAVFPDVLPVTARLRAAGIKTAVISNADDDVTALCAELAFADAMDAIITSAVVGWEKPDPRTFRAALDATATAAADALHIGDQPRSDVVGALGVGMRAALIDRYDRHPDGDDAVPRLRGLTDLADYVLGENGARTGPNGERTGD